MPTPPPAALEPRALKRRCDPATLGFQDTRELSPPERALGQDRALSALDLGISIRKPGYGIFALGSLASDKREVVSRVLEQRAADMPVPDDWCYVDDFERPFEPRALRLPAGKGAELRDDLEQLMVELRAAVPAALQNEEFRTRSRLIEDELNERREHLIEELRTAARERGLALLQTPVAFVFAPTKDGEVIEPEAFEALPAAEQKRLANDVRELEERLETALAGMPEWAREARLELRQLAQEMTKFAISHQLRSMQSKYEAFPEVASHFEAVERQIVDHVDDFLPEPESGMRLGRAGDDRPHLRRYLVNLLVDNRGSRGAPIVFEENPNYANLVGRIEHLSEGGTMVTDLGLIAGGALHRANGGFLVLDARSVLTRPYAWDALKRALRTRELRIESLGETLSLVSTLSLKPQSIPLDVKVVLLGDRWIYYLLSTHDPEFDRLFKVAADFDESVERNQDNERLYARTLAGLVAHTGVRHLERDATALVVEQASRLAHDAERLSTDLLEVSDLLTEADLFAERAGATLIGRDHVQAAIDAQIHRLDRVRERAHDRILRDTIFVRTSGAEVGQVNGLAVVRLGRSSFGVPSRITATVRLGKGEVVDIEREVDLGGPVHSKGVLILVSFLCARFGVEQPLSVSASIAFEQNYGGVDGDSASSTELYALLSAIGEIPLEQSIAVTGSVDQHGRVQPIGGINEKIEAFFDICHARGLTGDQGVMVPAANVEHLMLRDDVIEAVEAGRFRIHPVEHVDQGIEILTGLPAGEADQAGDYAEGSVGARVQARVREFAERRARFGKSPTGDPGAVDEGPS